LSSGNVGIGTTGIAGTSNAVNLTTSGASGAITVLANGNVGIGTTVPTAKLHINGGYLIGFPLMALLQDRKSQNVAGGGATVGGIQRTLNVVLYDTIGLTLTANSFTLPAGTYGITISAPGNFCNRHRITLYNTLTNSDILFGTSEFSGTGTFSIQSRSFIDEVLGISVPTTFGVKHYFQTASPADGLGVPSNFNTEIYTICKIVQYTKI
jgi:hypothetical protein